GFAASRWRWAKSLGPLLPDHGEMDDGLNSLFHILHAYPFQPRMERVLPRENVGAGQPHQRKPRAIGAAPNRRLDWREPGATYRLHRMLHDFGMTIDHLLDRKSTRLNSSHSQISYA